MLPIDDKVAHQIICLRNIANVLSDSESDAEDVLNTLVHLLPEGWQFPSEAACRIVFDSNQVKSVNHRETPWVLSSTIVSNGKPVGTIEIGYLSEKPEADEGPFLLLERNLLDIIASEIGAYLERKQMELTRERQHRELELYASLLRHDLKNDVSVLLGNVDAIRMLLSDRGELVEDLLVSVEAVCDRMLSLLTALGTSTKAPEKKIAELIRIAVKQAQEADMNLKITVDIDCRAEDLTVPESALLPMVFDNLLRNASTHAGERPRVNIRICTDDDKARIIVSDDGPGIAEEVRARLFTKGGSSRPGGGLGLYLSRKVVEALGGSMDLIDSPPGSGATFNILLPLT
jgi:signal transduction histidine kinase